MLNDRKYVLNLFDSAGQVIWEISNFSMVYFCFRNQEEYDQLRIMAYPNTNVFILCFSVVDPDSYSNILSKWIPELNRMFFSLSLWYFSINNFKIKGYTARVPIILVGTKIDLRHDSATLEQLAEKNQRPISQSEGEHMARICSAKAYLECSSILNFNVRNVFQQAIEVYLSANQRSRNGLSSSRRMVSTKFQSGSWLGTLFCCTKKQCKSKYDLNNWTLRFVCLLFFYLCN